VISATPGIIGFDFDSPLSAADANSYFNRGYQFCVRYVSRTDASRAANADRGTADLSVDEGAAILAGGLALMAVQHVAEPGWMPTEALGTEYGTNAATYAADAGLPGGVNLWLDLEGVSADAAATDVIAYCNAWFAAVEAAGYVSGVYVGFGVNLTPDQLYFDLTTKHYWKAGGDIQDISHRGYQLIQNINNPGTPQEFDRNVTQNDAFDGAVVWLAPAS
jgi:hypothetical protein